MLCSKFNDIKPNWAVVGAIACLQRNDFNASLRAIKGVAIGSISAWPISNVISLWIKWTSRYKRNTGLDILLISLVCSFEISLKPRLHLQVISSGLMILAVTCVSTGIGKW